MTHTDTDHEMHPTRWGDPAAAAPLPESARGLIELAFGPAEPTATADPVLPVSALPADLLDGLRALVGPEHVLVDDDTRRRRTRGKSTPDLLRARAGDLSDAPDAVVRPDGHDEVGGRAGVRRRAPDRGRPVRRRHLRHRRSGRAPRRLRGPGLARPGPDEAAARRRRGLDDGDPRARPPRARRPRRCWPSTASRSATSRSRSSTRPSAASRPPARAVRPAPATAGSTPWWSG